MPCLLCALADTEAGAPRIEASSVFNASIFSFGQATCVTLVILKQPVSDRTNSQAPPNNGVGAFCLDVMRLCIKDSGTIKHSPHAMVVGRTPISDICQIWQIDPPLPNFLNHQYCRSDIKISFITACPASQTLF
jgi:hypothetical protein